MKPASILRSLPLLALGAVALAGCGRKVPVGVVLTQSGPQSSLGIDIRDGILLAQDDLAAKPPDPRLRLELRMEDDANDPARALALDKALVEGGAAAVIGHATSALTLEALPYFNERRVPLVSPTASSRALSGLDDSFFRLVSSNSQESVSLARYARVRMALRSALIIVDTSNKAYGDAWSADFMAAFTEGGAAAASLLPFDSSAKPDLAALVRASGALVSASDCAVFVCASADLAFLAQDLRRGSYGGPFLSSGWAKSPDTIRLGGRAVEGLLCSEMFDQASGSAAYAAFRERFAARYGREPTGAAVQGYETLGYVYSALASKTASAIAGFKSIRSMRGLQGEILFTEDGDAIRPSFFVKVELGQFRPAER